MDQTQENDKKTELPMFDDLKDAEDVKLSFTDEHDAGAFVKTMPVMSGGFQIETEISIWAVDRRWRVADVPIDYRDRPEGSESKLSTFSDGMLVLAAIVVVGTLAAFGLYLHGVSIVGSVKGGLLGTTEPASAMVFAALWLGTMFTWADWIGLVLMVAMIFLVTLSGSKEAGDR